MSALGIIEIGSVSKGLDFANEIRRRGNIGFNLIKCPSPSNFISIVTGDRAEMVTVLDHASRCSWDVRFRKMIIPDPDPRLLPVLFNGVEPMKKMTGVANLGVIEIFGFCSMALCGDLALKQPNVTVLGNRFDPHSEKGVVYLSTSADHMMLLTTFIKEMREKLGIDLLNYSVIAAPDKKMLSAFRSSIAKDPLNG